MNKKSIRIQLDDSQYEILESICDRHNCSYNGRISIGKLLTKIASGKLDVLENRLVEPDSDLVEMTIRVAMDMNGNIGNIAEAVKNAGGNITDIRSFYETNLIRLSFSLPDESYIGNLVKNVYNISFADVIDYNPHCKIETVIGNLSSTLEKAYCNSDADPLLKKSILKNLSLVSRVQIIFGIAMQIENESGRLAEITKIIAARHISIISINQKVDPNNPKYNFLELYVGVTFSAENKLIEDESSFPTIKTIRSLMDDMLELSFVKNVSRVSTKFA